MKLLPPLPLNSDQICFFEQSKVLCDRLPRHIQSFAEFVQCLATLGVEAVKQLPAARIG
jgi:hypothetical protein